MIHLNWIEEEVEKVIKKCGTANPYEIAKAFDITISYHPLPKGHKGYSALHKRIRHIVLADNMTQNETIAVLCHELGHSFLHPGINTTFFKDIASSSFESGVEYEANSFMFYLISKSIDINQFPSVYSFLNYINMPYSMEPYLENLIEGELQ